VEFWLEGEEMNLCYVSLPWVYFTMHAGAVPWLKNETIEIYAGMEYTEFCKIIEVYTHE